MKMRIVSMMVCLAMFTNSVRSAELSELKGAGQVSFFELMSEVKNLQWEHGSWYSPLLIGFFHICGGIKNKKNSIVVRNNYYLIL